MTNPTTKEVNAKEVARALRWLARETEFVFAAEQLREAADLIESLQADNAELRKANSEYQDAQHPLFMALSAAQRRERAAVEELDILHERLGGELPKRCKDCELWGKAGWSQHEIGYCEGDDHPHKGTDFCNRWRGAQAGEENE